jgi:hypothetical protein
VGATEEEEEEKKRKSVLLPNYYNTNKVRSYDQCNEPSGYIKGEEFTD